MPRVVKATRSRCARPRARVERTRCLAVVATEQVDAHAAAQLLVDGSDGTTATVALGDAAGGEAGALQLLYSAVAPTPACLILA